ncbi:MULTISPECIES: dihydroxyacetone kinase subunit DhaL [unclassified Gilliamella]|uniref:dihydroxyacetone kinase subunit DhaL n=1 Tax=unclassified Gilliamella TaxID=2685620 RepID=UPI00226A0C4C|nr:MULTISPECIES: dihydroxyacetone kinase subunit DhaL [unclassified Gilliamella]MCX8642277.1 dihydroxyacetone kinase subunit L [Gilliamella sp. B3835]MCX8707675.1 dihydroxyacetone kinase subunit L [Gilliamella sp. B3783]MCX8709998.1 dihydroxyacetone kinase subunit L [Gilliamella sp. B3780]MCX8713466.1 dihydroxyacetone kinase subunit L [Gilliamella sp. B3781]MCX8716658.1 dihydroxyacetone kinase subunit L [Gilliamella sp. B3784]
MSALMLNKSYFIETFKKIADMAEKNRDHLSKLDSDIGDGDHGINLTIGFREVEKQLPLLSDSTADIAELMKKVGMILLSKVGGASGPLYGSFFMKMANHTTGKQAVTFKEFCQMYQDGVEAVQMRGKAELNDKTMIDALIPGLNVLNNYKEGDDPVKTLEICVDEMKKGSDLTIPLVAKKGRSMRLGERAIGHKDAGSESAWMIMNEFLQQLKLEK